MPIYEFYCPDNHKVYQFYARSSAQAERIPTCPDNPDFRMVKRISGFAIGSGANKSAEGASPAEPDMEDPRMRSAMAEMERAVAGMDENNPDPRQMGKLMRQMVEMSGEPLTGEMEAMVRKLEEGADPSEIEEQFGDLLGDEDGLEDSMTGPGGEVLENDRPGSFRGPPVKDDTLYEFD